MQAEFSYVTLNTEIETEIYNTNVTKQPIHIYIKISKQPQWQQVRNGFQASRVL